MHETVRSTATDTFSPEMVWVIAIIMIVTFLALVVFAVFVSRTKITTRPLPRPCLPKEVWDKLFKRGEDVISKTISQLPHPIKIEAEKLNVVLRKWNPEKLGCFMHMERIGLASPGGAIIIYVGSVYQNCEGTDSSFDKEIRITYLHELGHFLGLSDWELGEKALQ